MAEADPSGSSPSGSSPSVADRCADLIVRLGSISAAAAGPPEPDGRLRTELADLERQVPPEVSRALDTWVMALSADEATDAATEAVIDEWFDRVCPGR
jgi:hypothetical protein